MFLIKDIVLIVGRQFCYKVVLKGLGTKPQVEDDHAEKKG